jgi:hypothetical protein
MMYGNWGAIVRRQAEDASIIVVGQVIQLAMFYQGIVEPTLLANGC